MYQGQGQPAHALPSPPFSLLCRHGGCKHGALCLGTTPSLPAVRVARGWWVSGDKSKAFTKFPFFL